MAPLNEREAHVRLVALSGDPLYERNFIVKPNHPVRVGRSGPSTKISNGPLHNNAIYPSGHVSRRHCEFSIGYYSPTLKIVDKGSMHGTFVNDKALVANQPRILSGGEVIALGKVNSIADKGPLRNVAFRVQYVCKEKKPEPAYMDLTSPSPELTSSAAKVNNSTGRVYRVPDESSESENASDVESAQNMASSQTNVADLDADDQMRVEAEETSCTVHDEEQAAHKQCSSSPVSDSQSSTSEVLEESALASGPRSSSASAPATDQRARYLTLEDLCEEEDQTNENADIELEEDNAMVQGEAEANVGLPAIQNIIASYSPSYRPGSPAYSPLSPNWNPKSSAQNAVADTAIMELENATDGIGHVRAPQPRRHTMGIEQNPEHVEEDRISTHSYESGTTKVRHISPSTSPPPVEGPAPEASQDYPTSRGMRELRALPYEPHPEIDEELLGNECDEQRSTTATHGGIRNPPQQYGPIAPGPIAPVHHRYDLTGGLTNTSPEYYGNYSAFHQYDYPYHWSYTDRAYQPYSSGVPTNAYPGYYTLGPGPRHASAYSPLLPTTRESGHRYQPHEASGVHFPPPREDGAKRGRSEVPISSLVNDDSTKTEAPQPATQATLDTMRYSTRLKEMLTAPEDSFKALLHGSDNPNQRSIARKRKVPSGEEDISDRPNEVVAPATNARVLAPTEAGKVEKSVEEVISGMKSRTLANNAAKTINDAIRTTEAADAATAAQPIPKRLRFTPPGKIDARDFDSLFSPGTSEMMKPSNTNKIPRAGHSLRSDDVSSPEDWSDMSGFVSDASSSNASASSAASDAASSSSSSSGANSPASDNQSSRTRTDTSMSDLDIEADPASSALSAADADSDSDSDSDVSSASDIEPRRKKKRVTFANEPINTRRITGTRFTPLIKNRLGLAAHFRRPSPPLPSSTSTETADTATDTAIAAQSTPTPAAAFTTAHETTNNKGTAMKAIKPFMLGALAGGFGVLSVLIALPESYF